MKRIWLFFIALIIISCAASKGINLSRISLGMTKEEVLEKLGKRPDNVIGSKQFPEGTVEVIQFSKYDAWTAQLTERYWLYFLDGKLKQWGRPGDWKKEADQIYEFRNR